MGAFLGEERACVARLVRPQRNVARVFEHTRRLSRLDMKRTNEQES
jgi:hypothetical protein